LFKDHEVMEKALNRARSRRNNTTRTFKTVMGTTHNVQFWNRYQNGAGECDEDLGHVAFKREDGLKSEKRAESSPQFKSETVQFVVETSHPVSEIAKELEIDKVTLYNRVKQRQDKNPEREGEALTLT